MDSIDQKMRIAACRNITDFDTNWTSLKIGTVYYDTFSEFKNEFGPTDLKTLRYLCAYYTTENPVDLNIIKDKKAKTALIAFLTKRKEAVIASNEFKSNAFTGKPPHTFVKELEIDIAKLQEKEKGKEGTGEAGAGAGAEAETGAEAGAEAGPDTQQTVSRDVLIKQFFKGLYLLSLTKGDKIKLSKDYDELIKDLDELPLDEALTNTRELLTQDARIAMKTKQNSLLKYIQDETPLSEEVAPKKSDKPNKETKNKLDIIKLITLFQTGEMLSGFNGITTDTTKLDAYFDMIAKELPHMVEDILFTYRSFTRFYRARYTNLMLEFGKLMNKFGLANYPIEAMIRLVFTMYNMTRFVSDDNFTDRYKVFKNKEGLLRFKLGGQKQTMNTTAILNLLDAYKEHFGSFKDASLDPNGKDDIVYQLLHIHSRTKREAQKPILQLISGKNILIKTEKLTEKLAQLQMDKEKEIPDDKLRASRFEELRKAIDSFFKDKDTTLYIIYQLTPDNLMLPTKENHKIKQLNTIQCGMASITDKLETVFTDDKKTQAETDVTIPKSIELKLASNKQLPALKEDIQKNRNNEILYSLASGNTFEDFGITIKEPLQLTQSITNITATLLNAQYLNNKLKDINKKLGSV